MMIEIICMLLLFIAERNRGASQVGHRFRQSMEKWKLMVTRRYICRVRCRCTNTAAAAAFTSEKLIMKTAQTQ